MTYERIATHDAAAFAATAADVLEHHLCHAIERRGRCILGCSGGRTPRDAYRLLGGKPTIDWSRVHLFLVDERCVPPDHPESNQMLLRETLLAQARIPDTHLCLPDTSLDPVSCADAYDRSLGALLEDPADIVILGMGTDGHIASLFPPLPDAAFGPKAAIHTTTDLFAVHDRISVTLPVLRAARHPVFLLAGADKLAAWEAMEHSRDERRWPAAFALEAEASAQLVCGTW